MKRSFMHFGALSLGLCCVAGAYAYDIQVDGIYYNILSTTDFTCEVTHGDTEYRDTVVIPATITYNNRTLDVVGIGDNAFSWNSDLESVKMPNSIIKVGREAFRWCNGIKEIVIPNSVTEMGDKAMYQCGKLENVTLGTSLKIIGSYAFAECSKLENIVLNEGLIEIYYDAFSSCKSLTSIVIPESVEKISDGAFQYCENLEYVALNENLEILGGNAFYGCKKLKSIVIPNQIETLDGVFHGCESLINVTLGSGIDKIESNAFAGCKSLAELNMLAVVPPIIEGDNFSNSNYMDMTVYVPDRSLETYRTADIWKNFWNIQGKDFSSGVTTDPIKERCEVPSLSLEGDRIVASCPTANADVRIIVSPDDARSETLASGESMTMNGQYQITAYAGAPDHLTSELVYATLVWVNPTLSSGIEDVNIPTHKAVMIRVVDGAIHISGTEDGEDVTVCTLDGCTVYAGKAVAGETIITCSGVAGEFVIVRYADKAIKIHL